MIRLDDLLEFSRKIIPLPQQMVAEGIIRSAWTYAESKATDREAQAAIERQPHEPGFYKRVQEPREDAGC